jgi:hypothetical protein
LFYFALLAQLLGDRDWERFGCTALVEAAFAAAIAPYRQLVVVTKMLHLKRPLLFPVLDASQPVSQRRHEEVASSVSVLERSLRAACG